MSANRRARLRTISTVAQWLALGSIALVVVYCGYLASDPAALTAYLQKDVPGTPAAPAFGALVMGAVFSLAPAGIFLAAMGQAYGLFRHLGAQQSFDALAQRRLMNLGGLAIAAALAGIASRTLVVLVMSANAFGQRHLVIAVGSSEMSALMIGCLLFAFAQLVGEFERVEDENRSFV